MADFLYRGRIDALDISLTYAVTSDLVTEAIKRHDCDPIGAHLFGRAITAGVLATSGLADKQRLNARWAYEGKLRTILVDAGPDGSTRALISPAQLTPVDNEDALYGERAEIRLVRSSNGQVESSGTAQSELQDVVEDLMYVLCTSDQVESAAAVMIGFSNDPEKPVTLCRGLMLQALPSCDLIRFQRIRDRLSGEAVHSLMARPQESDSLLENAVNLLTREETNHPRLEFAETGTPRFVCNCSAAKMGAVMRALPHAERMDIVQKKQPVKVTCHFCNRHYELSIDDCIHAWNDHPASPVSRDRDTPAS